MSNVIPSDFPEAVIGLAVLSITTRSVSLHWMFQMNGSSPRTGVDIEIRRYDSVENTVMTGPSQTMSDIYYLQPLTTYNFTIYVITAVGRSLPTAAEISTYSLREQIILINNYVEL